MKQDTKKQEAKSASLSSSWLCGRKSKSSFDTVKNANLIIQQADDYLQSLVDNRTFSGSILLARDGQILLIKGYGCADYVFQEKNTSQTAYRIGSVTKCFTSTIILKLHERKQLDINAKLSGFLPDYSYADQITIKQLLSNTSGINDYTEMNAFNEACEKNMTIDQLIEIFKNEPLKFKPGSKYEYSNSNYILLGFIIEKVTGKSYESNLRQWILEPCNMKDTGYECECENTAEHDLNQRACGYICNTDDNGIESCRLISLSTARGAGGIHSTIEDLYKFDRCLYNETVLKNRTKKLMFTPVKEQYALGWQIPRLAHGRLCQQHEGQIFGFTSCLTRFPNENACIVMLSNFEHTPIQDVIERLTDILFEQNN